MSSIDRSLSPLVFLPELRKYAMAFDSQSFSRNLYLTQCINLLTRSASRKFDRTTVDAIVAVVVELIAQRDSIDIDLANCVAEVLELHILTIDALYGTSAAALHAYTP